MNNPYRFNNFRRPNNNRFGGGFLFPFVLGGITGSLLTPNYPPRPPYPPYNYYYRPYPYYY